MSANFKTDAENYVAAEAFNTDSSYSRAARIMQGLLDERKLYSGVMSALLDALDKGLVVFKTNSGLVVAGHPWDLDKDKIAALMEAEMIWDLDDLAEARKLT